MGYEHFSGLERNTLIKTNLDKSLNEPAASRENYTRDMNRHSLIARHMMVKKYTHAALTPSEASQHIATDKN